jgi:hypothetical protein
VRDEGQDRMARRWIDNRMIQAALEFYSNADASYLHAFETGSEAKAGISGWPTTSGATFDPRGPQAYAGKQNQ